MLVIYVFCVFLSAFSVFVSMCVFVFLWFHFYVYLFNQTVKRQYSQLINFIEILFYKTVVSAFESHFNTNSSAHMLAGDHCRLRVLRSYCILRCRR